MLGEHATEVDLPGFGLPVGLFALAPLQFFPAHRDASAVGADVQDGNGRGRTGGGLRLAPLPVLRSRSYPAHQSLDLPGLHRDAPRLFQMPLGLFVAGFVCPFQAGQPNQSRRVSRLQPQRVVRRTMSAASHRPIVVALQRERAEQTTDLDRCPFLEVLPGQRPVGGVGAVRDRLEQLADNLRPRLEQCGADQPLDVENRQGVARRREKPLDQPLEFPVLRREEARGGFFLLPSRSARVTATTSPAYCATSAWNVR